MVVRGILLFLFIPAVLFLYLAEPMGVVPSLLVGIVLMVGHRFIAAPFSAGHRHERCLWCGRGLRGAAVGGTGADGAGAESVGGDGAGADGPGAETVEVRDPGDVPVAFRFCSREARDCRRSWLGLHRLAVRGSIAIRLGILLPVVYYLLAELARGFLGRSWLGHESSVLIFQGVIAAVVVSISFLYLSARPARGEDAAPPAGRFPFPLHNLSLLGARWTLWIFRVVGIWWLVRVLARVAGA